MSLHPGGSDRAPFWSVFERSVVPMTLLDSNRRYVAVNDAAVDLYQRPREEIVGSRATSGMADPGPAVADAIWARFMRMGEVYGEKVVRISAGPPLRVSFAAHATKVDDEWRILFMTLSAMVEPGGEQLIGGVRAVGPGDPAPHRSAPDAARSANRLTARERQIIEHVADGRRTPQIAEDLSVSPATVRSHVRNAMVKTGAHTRAHLVAIVLGNGWLG